MTRMLWIGCMAAAAAATAGCASGPVPGNPLIVNPTMTVAAGENPIFVPQGPEGYALVFDRTFDVVNEYFPVAYSNRFAGEIASWPLMTAGYLDWPRLGCYDSYELLESTFQTVRRRALVLITPADSGGYYIDVQVLKELEDLPRPTHASAGAAVIRYEIPMERQYEVIDPTVFSKGWIPIGRDHALEQVILCKLRECL